MRAWGIVDAERGSSGCGIMRLIRRLGLLSWALAAAHVLCAIAYAPAHAQDVLKDPANHTTANPFRKLSPSQ